MPVTAIYWKERWKIYEKKKEEPKVASQQSQVKSLEKELKKVEDQIELLQNNKIQLENEMATPEVYTNGEKLKKAKFDLEKINKEIAAANTKWEQIVTSMDELTSGA